MINGECVERKHSGNEEELELLGLQKKHGVLYVWDEGVKIYHLQFVTGQTLEVSSRECG